MHYYKVININIVVIAAVLMFTLCGCGEKPADKGRIIAKVNGEAIYSEELKRAIALKTVKDPSFTITPETFENEINMIIDKKILIQEARDNGLDRTARFENTIKTFWEQTLIRDLMASKAKVFNAMDLSKIEKQEKFKAWMDELRKSSDIEMDKSEGIKEMKK